MRGDIPTPALRLLSSLPVRTIERRPVERMSRQLEHYHANKELRGRGKSVIFGKGGKARPVKIGPVVYPSATDAARTLRKSTGKIYEWLRTGEAEYA